MPVRPGLAAAGGLALGREVQFLPSLAIATAALSVQMLLTVLHPSLNAINLCLLSLVWIALKHRSYVTTALIGALVGWLQDGLTYGPLGVFGLVYTILAASTVMTKQMLRVELPTIFCAIFAVAYWLHELLLHLIRSVLVGDAVSPQVQLWTALAVLHGGIVLAVRPLVERLTESR